MANIDLQEVWKTVLASVKVSVSSAVFTTYISQTHLASLTTGKCDIGCESSFVKNMVEKRYAGLLQDILEKELGEQVTLTFSVHPRQADVADDTALSPLFATPKASTNLDKDFSKARLRPLLTFANFAVSSSNQMAWAAAEAVAKSPGEAYNPLFIHGGVGVGKTHLMNAVGHYLLDRGITEVYFCTSEEFTNDIVEGIRNKSTQAFRTKYRKLKALLIDDIQFLAGKDAVQEEFFHTFNALTASGSQIIMTSDRPPEEIAKLEERLRNRFEAGLIVDISPPDFELRCAIIQIKTQEKGVDLPSELVQLIAANIAQARKIEGFLTKLFSQVTLKKQAIDEDLVKSLLATKDGENGQKTRKSPADIIDLVCNHYNISKRVMVGKGRARVVARPRQILMYLLRIECGLPLEEVGSLIGGRDHTTVMHAVDKITSLAKENVTIREDLLGIKQRI